jgi:hypothetical protein
VVEALRGYAFTQGPALNKTELLPLNLDNEEIIMLAAVTGCKLSTFPLQYLGVPLSDKKLKSSNWQGIIDKVQDKTQNWKGLYYP